MRIASCLFVLLVFVVTARARDDEPDKSKPPAQAESIDQLIVQLNAESFKAREEAVRRLIAAGPPALAALRRTAEDQKLDPDVRLRAARAAYAIATVKIEMVRRLGGQAGTPNTEHSGWSRRIALSPDGKHAVTAGGDCIRYWNLANGKLIRSFGENRNGFWSVSFSADGRRVIAGGSKVCLFDVNTGKPVHEMAGHSQVVWGTVLTANGKLALSGAWDNSIRVWDTESGKEVRALKGVQGMVRCLALSPDGKLLAAGQFPAAGGGGTVGLWDVEKGTEVRTLKGHGARNYPRRIPRRRQIPHLKQLR